MSAQVLYSVLTRPVVGMRQLRASRTAGVAFATIVAAAISFAVSLPVISVPGNNNLGGVTLLTLSVIAAALALWIFLGALTHAAANLLGGYGRFSKFLAGYAMATVPFTLCTAAAVILTLWSWGPTAYFWFVFFLSLWWWGLTITAVREVYGLSAGVAVVVSLLPYVLLIGVQILLLLVRIAVFFLQAGV